MNIYVNLYFKINMFLSFASLLDAKQNFIIKNFASKPCFFSILTGNGD